MSQAMLNLLASFGTLIFLAVLIGVPLFGAAREPGESWWQAFTGCFREMGNELVERTITISLMVVLAVLWMGYQILFVWRSVKAGLTTAQKTYREQA